MTESQLLELFRVPEGCQQEETLVDLEFLARLPELAGKTLGCWCRPLACHGDVLAEMVDAVEADFGSTKGEVVE